MNLTEKILGLLVLCCIAGTLFLVPGTGFLLLLSLLCLSFLYFFLSFALFNRVRFRKIAEKESYQGIPQKRIVGAIGAGLALSAGLFGILFRFQSWPGAAFHLYTGSVSLFIVSVVAFVKYRSSKAGFYQRILIRGCLVLILVSILIILPKDALLDFQYRNYPVYLKALKDYRLNPENEELKNRMLEEREKMYWDQAK